MLIDFDLITIIIGVVCYLIWCWFIHKKYHKEKIYYIYSTIMFIYFMVLINVTLFPIMMIDGMPFVSKINSLTRSAISGAVLGGCIELIQYIETFLTGGFTLRTIDINDVIFNCAGSIVGFILLYGVAQFVCHLNLNDKKLNAFWSYAYHKCRGVVR